MKAWVLVKKKNKQTNKTKETNKQKTKKQSILFGNQWVCYR